jgi:choline dehydrogenase-like flavoprotein
VNAGVAVRAWAADFARWGGHGAEGWSFGDVLPAFKLMESTPTGDDAHHGRTCPLPIRQRTDDELTPSLRGFVEAAVAHGFKRVHDFNGAEQNGVDGYPLNVVDGGPAERGAGLPDPAGAPQPHPRKLGVHSRTSMVKPISLRPGRRIIVPRLYQDATCRGYARAHNRLIRAPPNADPEYRTRRKYSAIWLYSPIRIGGAAIAAAT